MGEAAPELTDSQLSAWNNGSTLVRSDWGSIPVDPQLTHSHSSLASRQGKTPITLSEDKLHFETGRIFSRAHPHIARSQPDMLVGTRAFE